MKKKDLLAARINVFVTAVFLTVFTAVITACSSGAAPQTEIFTMRNMAIRQL